MKTAAIVFPNQLFEQNPAVIETELVYLVEEYLFFKQYNFHKQKLVFHRASMKFYEDYLKEQKKQVIYIDSNSYLSDVRNLIPYVRQQGIDTIYITEVIDNWLEKRIFKSSKMCDLKIQQFKSPMFLNSKEEIIKYFRGKEKFLQTDFYIHQRKNLNLLLDESKKPAGGRWTYDSDNRLKYPSKKIPPKVNFPPINKYTHEAIEYVHKNFPNNYGMINEQFNYPVTFDESKKWFQEFLETRLEEFGPYEDAIVDNENVLHHSLLSPMLNSGLLTPNYVLEKTINFTGKKKIPINSLEGFIRQIIGWREFIRAVYELKGTEQRTKNFWNFNRKIPQSFWEGETGIEPLDITIKKVLKTGYCHHIERLMVIGNFMLLCEFNPDEVYRWFMELFIDAYDWVMVPNVYGMSQFADGGLMSTKPYISGSNYLLKMSNFKRGHWQLIWDGLFWRFMDKHRDFFLSNPRLGMLIKNFDKMPDERKKILFTVASEFLKKL